MNATAKYMYFWEEVNPQMNLYYAGNSVWHDSLNPIVGEQNMKKKNMLEMEKKKIN